jgi:uncharacterized protein
VRIAIDIDSTLHDHWPLVAAAALRRYGLELPYEEQVPATTRRLTEAQLRACIADTHTDAAIAGARPYPGAVRTVNAWSDAGHEIHVMSHRPDRSLLATGRWLDAIGLRRHGLHTAADKVADARRLGAGLLVDDLPATLLRARDAGLLAATLRHPWNAHLCERPDIVCAADWPELARRLEPVLEPRLGGSGTGTHGPQDPSEPAERTSGG